jgi:hypothetical protein
LSTLTNPEGDRSMFKKEVKAITEETPLNT